MGGPMQCGMVVGSSPSGRRGWGQVISFDVG